MCLTWLKRVGPETTLLSTWFQGYLKKRGSMKRDIHTCPLPVRYLQWQRRAVLCGSETGKTLQQAESKSLEV